MINEPTRITITTTSLIDHVVTNTPEKISHSGVVHTGISDHSFVYAIRKIRLFQKVEDFVEIRNMRNFNETKFVDELLKQHWEYIYFFGEEPNSMWEIWKELFLEVLNKHGKRQNADPRSADYLCGPGPWTTLVDHLQNFADRTMDRALLTQV